MHISFTARYLVKLTIKIMTMKIVMVSKMTAFQIQFSILQFRKIYKGNFCVTKDQIFFWFNKDNNERQRNDLEDQFDKIYYNQKQNYDE